MSVDNIDVPPDPTISEASEEVTPEQEEIIEAVVDETVDARIEEVCADLLDRIERLEEKVGELNGRHEGYATREHSHGEGESTAPRNEPEPDERPRADHPWFRRVGE